MSLIQLKRGTASRWSTINPILDWFTIWLKLSIFFWSTRIEDIFGFVEIVFKFSITLEIFL